MKLKMVSPLKLRQLLKMELGEVKAKVRDKEVVSDHRCTISTENYSLLKVKASKLSLKSIRLERKGLAQQSLKMLTKKLASSTVRVGISTR
jgi:hypothetical protein